VFLIRVLDRNRDVRAWGSLEDLRELNRLRVVDELRRRGSASRGDVARATGLSRTTVTTLVTDLQERVLIVEAGGNGDGHTRTPAGIAGIAGEIGHVQVRSEGAVCRCGNRGCLETVAGRSRS
jgi:ROK family protein/regulatory Crp family protein